jgi:hypothetical protein
MLEWIQMNDVARLVMVTLGWLTLVVGILAIAWGWIAR